MKRILIWPEKNFWVPMGTVDQPGKIFWYRWVLGTSREKFSGTDGYRVPAKFIIMPHTLLVLVTAFFKIFGKFLLRFQNVYRSFFRYSDLSSKFNAYFVYHVLCSSDSNMRISSIEKIQIFLLEYLISQN